MKMFRSSPYVTVQVICFTLLAQVCQLLAMLLPLKVILMMGSDGIPSFFPSFMQTMERTSLVIGLSFGAVLLYLAYLGMATAADRTAAIGAASLNRRNQKLALFPNQEDFTREIYARVARSSAGLIFTLLALTGIGIVYPHLAATAALFLLLAGVVATYLNSRFEPFRQWLSSHYAPLIGNLAAACLFVCLGVAIYDYLNGTFPPFLFAVISILLTRQYLTKLQASLIEMFRLVGQRAKLDSLVFFSVPFAGQGKRISEKDILDPETLETWLPDFLGSATGRETRILGTQWVQLGSPMALLFECRTRDAAGDGYYYVKIYPRSNRHLAEHERMLAREPGALELMPELVGNMRMGDDECLLFSALGTSGVPNDQFSRLHQQMLKTTARFKPSSGLARAYSRSKVRMIERIDEDLCGLLRLAATSAEERQQVNDFQRRLPSLRNEVDNLPLWLFSPDLNGNTLRIGPQGNPLCLHWPRWSIEPLGAGLPIALLPELETVLELDSGHRPDLKGASPIHIRLAAYLFRLDRLCGRNRYRDGLRLLPFILSPEYAANDVPSSVMTSDY